MYVLSNKYIDLHIAYICNLILYICFPIIYSVNFNLTFYLFDLFECIYQVTKKYYKRKCKYAV